MKILSTLLLACTVLCGTVPAQSVYLGWAFPFGGNGSAQGKDLYIGGIDGSTVIVGRFTGTMDADPGASTQNLVSAGNEDIFILKLDQYGTFLWAKSIGGSDVGDQAYSVDCDPSGNIYVTGSFNGTMDFDPGAGVDMHTGSYDMFIAKLDANGNHVWAKTMGSSGQPDFAYSIDIDPNGELLVGGVFGGSVDFDPGPGTANLQAVGGGPNAYQDAFVLKLTAAGQFVWVKQMGGISQSSAHGIVAASNGDVHVTGRFRDTVDFDPGAGVFNLVAVNEAALFIAKLNSSGDLIWAKSIDSPQHDQGNGIALDGSGNVFVTGYFGGATDFDPGTGTYMIQSLAISSAFMMKLDPSGNLVWANGVGLEAGLYGDGFGVAVDQSGNAYFGGAYYGSTDFDPGPGSVILPDVGDNNAYVAKYDPQGALLFAVNYVSANTAFVSSLGLDGAGGIYTTGSYIDTTDFDPSPATGYAYGAGQNEYLFGVKLYEPLVSATAPSQAFQATAYPNPAQDMLRIQSDARVEEVKLLNAQGILIRTERQTTFSVVDLPGGLYLLRVRARGDEATLRFVKAD